MGWKGVNDGLGSNKQCFRQYDFSELDIPMTGMVSSQIKLKMKIASLL